MNEEIDPSSVFVAAKQAADDARAVLIARLEAIKGEAHEIRTLLGRTRAAKAFIRGAKKTRKARITGIEQGEQA
jgi:hypothetical protein